MLLGLRTDPGDEQPWDQSWSSRAEIHQATGMVLAQLEISATDAFARLRAHAFAEQRLLGDVARDVVARRLRSPTTPDTATGVWKGDAAVDEAGTSREQLLIRAFVGLADTLVDDYDIIDLLDRLVGYSVELLAADAAGILLADPQGELRVVASSNEQTEWIELHAAAGRRGPLRGVLPHRRPGQRHRPGGRGTERGRGWSPPSPTGTPTARCTRCRCGCAARPSAR